MKPVLYNDVLAAVSYLSGVAPVSRKAALDRLMMEVDWAEGYAQTYNAAHPVFGDGTLMAAAMRYGVRGSTCFQSVDSLSVWISVLTALKNRLAQPEAQLMQRVAVGSNSSRLSAIASSHSSQ